jgi:pilus assembly protein CpaF
LRVVVHLRREADGRRRLAQVSILQRGADGLVDALPAVTFETGGTATTGPGAKALERLLRGD